MTTILNKKNKAILLIAAGLITLLFSFQNANVSNAWFGEQAWEDFKSCVKGECPDDQQQTSFTQFTGGLTPPETTGYAEGLVRQTDLREFIVQVTNFALGFLGLIAVVIVIYGGFMYVTAAGEQEKAEKGKKAVTYAVIGIVLILGSFAIVNTVLQAPTGEDTGLRGSGEFGESVVGTSGAVRFNVIAAKVEKMALDLASAHIFHFEARKDLNQAKAIVDAVNAQMAACASQGYDTVCGNQTTLSSDAIANNAVGYFTSQINNAITILQAVKAKVTNSVITGSFIKETIDDEITALTAWKNLAESRRGTLAAELLDSKEVAEGKWEAGDVRPGFQDFTGAPFADYYNAITTAHTATETAVAGNFTANVNNAVSDLNDIYAVVSVVTSAANDAVNVLAEETPRGQGACMGASGGLLCRLNDAVVKSQLDTPGPADPEYSLMSDTYNALIMLHKIISTMQFVDARISASVVEGSAPLAVTFSSIGSTDPSGLTIENSQIQWDLNGDGDYTDADTNCKESGVGPTTSCIYTKPGTYRAKLKIDASGSPISDDDTRFEDKTKKYNEVIGAGVAVIDIRVHEPETKINLQITNMQGDQELDKYVVKYGPSGYLEVDRSAVVFPLSIASGQGVSFDANLTTTRDGALINTQAGEGATVYWDFGDNSTDGINKTLMAASSGNLVQNHVYNQEGKYNVMVEFADKNKVVDRKIFTLHVSSLAPHVSLSTRSAKVGDQIEFDAGNSMSDNGPIAYEWSISGPGVQPVTSTEEVFTRSFTSPNRYIVTLVATDPVITEGIAVSDSFEVASQPPVAQFNYEIPDAAQPASVVFDGTRSYDPDSEAVLEYLWEVNGVSLKKGTKGNESAFTYDAADNTKPIIKFKNAGTYTVSLTAIDPNGGGQNIPQDSAPLEREVMIEKTIDIAWGENDKPSGILKADAASGENSAEMTFTLISENAVAYEIDYGDGAVEQGEMSGNKTLSHIYKEAGTFVVQASVFDADDVENNIKKKVFISSADSPAAVIGVSVNGMEMQDLTETLEINRKDVVSFDAGDSINTDGTGRRLTYGWDFGDGGRATTKTANHTFGEVGTYNVTLKVVNENDVTQTATDKITITVAGEPPILKSLTAAPVGTSLTAPVTVQLNAVGAEDPDGQITRFRWWYYDPANDQDQLGVQVTTGATANVVIGTRGSEGEQKEYKFGVEITDDENNTVSSAEILAPSMIPSLTITNGPNKAPVASFNVDRTSIFVGEEVNFSSSSSDPDGQITAYFWDLEGDGFANNSTSLGPNVSHIFTTPAPDGIRVRLKVRDNNESEATSQPVTIFVDSMAQPPVAAFTSVQDEESAKVTFTDTSTADEVNKLSIGKWNWDFDISLDSNGDGKADNDLDSTVQNPVYIYPEYGIYRAKLTVFDDQGQSANVTNFVNVRAPQTTTSTSTTTTPALDARLLTTPSANLSDGKVHLKGDNVNVTLDYSTSVGEITAYIIDKNIYFDTNGNGIKEDDEDHRDTKPGKWTTDFSREWGNIKVRLTVMDKAGKKDFVDKDIVFDSETSAGSVSSLGANVMGASTSDILTVLVSMAGFAILILSLRKVNKER